MRNVTLFNHISPMSLEELPSSVRAQGAWSGVSSKYQFLSTLKVTEALQSVGLYPFFVKQAGTRIEGKEGYTKHLLRFRGLNVPAIKGNIYPEVVLQNAHDRASSFMLEMGLFRMVCTNGLVVSFGNWGKYRIRHVASSIEDVLVAAESIVELFPMIETRVSKMQGTMLSPSQALSFAERAIALRWEEGKAPFNPERLLTSRRVEDEGSDLWTVLNVIQENLLQGLRITSRLGGERSSRRIQAIETSQAINRGLWELAEGL